MWWIVLVIVGVAIGGYLLASGFVPNPFFTPANVVGVESGTRDDKTLALFVGACASETQVWVDENDQQVIVDVQHRAKTGGCAGSVRIDLGEPLGDRRLVDAFDGVPIPFPPWGPGGVPLYG